MEVEGEVFSFDIFRSNEAPHGVHKEVHALDTMDDLVQDSTRTKSRSLRSRTQWSQKLIRIDRRLT
ncbi:unnamed protein product [Rhodiola kirilowii]